MSPAVIPIAMVLSVGGLLLLCRPYLEASRPVASAALLAGLILGPSVTGLVPVPALAGLEPLHHLAAGWLVLGVSMSWDIGSLRRLGALRFLPLLALAGAFPGAVAILWPAALGSDAGAGLETLLAPFLLATAIAVCLDPSAARASLLSSSRPDTATRHASGLASLAAGCALAVSALVPPGASTLGAVDLLVRAGWAVALGAGLGLIFGALMRMAQGKGALLALLLSLALLAQGLADRLALSPLAVLFVAGTLLANDGARREMLGVILQELERPFLVALLLLAGASVPLGGVPHGAGPLAAATAAFVLGRWIIWTLIGKAGPGSAALPFSPLALVLALQAGGLAGWGGAIPVLAAASFVLGEAAWIGLRWR